MNKRVVELFAGVGGFRLGLTRASSEWDFVWANQWEGSRKRQDAFECYDKNFGVSSSHSNCDITKVDKHDIPNHDLLVGGFPCQDYSIANSNAKGLNGKKGHLWWSIYNILKEKGPSFVLLENVDRLLKSPSKQRGEDFRVILSCFRELAYTVEWRIINAAEYGFPQRRRRVFIFAYRDNIKYNSGNFFEELSKNNKISDNIETNIYNIEDSTSINFLNSGIMIDGIIYAKSIRVVCNNSLVLGDILESNINNKYYIGTDIAKWIYMKGSKKINRISNSGHAYVFAEGSIAFPDYLDRPARTMLTSEASKNRSTHIIKDATGRLRTLTPIECERLNGFPDNWTNTGMTERFRYFCMGNALVVGLIEMMGIKLIEIINKED